MASILTHFRLLLLIIGFLVGIIITFPVAYFIFKHNWIKNKESVVTKLKSDIQTLKFNVKKLEKTVSVKDNEIHMFKVTEKTILQALRFKDETCAVDEE